MTHSSIVMGDSLVLCKNVVLTENPMPLMRRASFGRPLQQSVLLVSTSTREPSPGSLVSLRSSMSMLCLASSQAMSVV